jgi:hypothetical protein
VSSQAPSALKARVTVLTGDPDHAVLGETWVGSDRHPYQGSQRAYVVGKHGHRHLIGRVGDFEGDWSINGHIVTSVSAHFDADLHLLDDVHWWDLSSGGSGVIHLARNDRYAAASTNGFYSTAHGWIYNHTISGHTTRLARPFPAWAHPTVASVHHGFVASGARKRAKLYREKTGALTRLPGHTHYRLRCGGKLHGLVACQAEKPREDEPSLYGVDLLVVRHHRAYFTRTPHTVPVATRDGATYIDGHRLRGIDRHGRRTAGAVRVDKAYVDTFLAFRPAIASAFDDAVLTRDHQRAVVRTAHAGARLHVVREAGRSPVTTSTAALGAGRIAWVQDSGAGGANEVYVASISEGVARDRHRLAGSSPGNGIAVSDTTVAYLTRRHGRPGLEVATSAGHSTFVAGVVDPVIGVSGDQVLYFTTGTDRGSGAVLGRAQVYDAATGATQQIGPPLNVRTAAGDGWRYAAPAALAEGRLTYQEQDGTVVTETIATHATETLRGPGQPAFDALSMPQIFAEGDFAGWNQGIECAYRDVVTMAAPVSLTSITGEFDVIDALTTAGVVYHNRVAPAVAGEAFSLAPYGEATGPTVLAGPDLGTPSINGATIAWVDRDGVLQAARR